MFNEIMFCYDMTPLIIFPDFLPFSFQLKYTNYTPISSALLYVHIYIYLCIKIEYPMMHWVICIRLYRKLFPRSDFFTGIPDYISVIIYDHFKGWFVDICNKLYIFMRYLNIRINYINEKDHINQYYFLFSFWIVNFEPSPKLWSVCFWLSFIIFFMSILHHNLICLRNSYILWMITH